MKRATRSVSATSRYQAERLAYAHWFAEEGYGDLVRRIWWIPTGQKLPPALYIFGEKDCLCYDTLPGIHTLCKYCDARDDCLPLERSVILPPDESQPY